MSWLTRLRNSARHGKLAVEIDEELQFHIESRTRDNIAAGMPPDEARQDALRRFGHPPAIRQETRDVNLIVALETTLQDLVFAARSLRTRPGFTAVALLTLALGIGANTAIFTVVRSVLLRPLPVPDPDELFVVSYTAPDGPFWLYPGMSDRNYVVFREATTSFESTTTFSTAPVTLTGAGDAARIARAMVTPDFFRVLRIRPAAGRAFLPEDEQPGRDRVVLMADGLWRSRYGADPGVLHRTIALDGVPHTVIGILPPEFAYPADAALWTPLAVEIKPGSMWSRPVVGRLRAGTTGAQALAAFEVMTRQFPSDPSRRSQPVARVRPLKEAVVGDIRPSLAIFSGAVAFVLLIACANVANLLLMRAVSRRHEMATRLALGASRGRLVRQLLTEAALLSIAGGLVGALVAFLAGPAIWSLIPAGRLPRDLAIHMDSWVLAFTVGLSIVTGLVLGLVPALQATREGPYAALREATASSTKRSHRLRHALVVAEMALALVLLIGAGLLVKSFLGLRAVDPGFTPGQVMTMTLDLPDTKYPTAVALNAFHERLLQSLSVLPDVTAAGAVNWLPLGDMLIRGDLVAEGGAGKGWATKASVSAGYFEAMGIRLVAGRVFSDRDNAAAPGVVILSESVARRIWPGEDPIGKRLSIESRPQPQDWLTVVGVVADVRQSGLAEDVVPAVYQPYQQVRRPGWLGRMAFVVRTSGSPMDVAPAMRTMVRDLDANLAAQSMSTMEDVITGTIAEPRFQTRLLGVFSLLALVLAAIGIYGVLSSAVAERRREIGIRVALGADRSRVVALVLRRTLMLTGIGVVLGLAGSLAVTRILSKLLFNVTPTDAATFATAAGVLVAVAVAAALIPARRASSVDPLVALRIE